MGKVKFCNKEAEVLNGSSLTKNNGIKKPLRGGAGRMRSDYLSDFSDLVSVLDSSGLASSAFVSSDLDSGVVVAVVVG